MNFEVEQEWENGLLRKPRLIREDVYLQHLTADELEMIREALERGLSPTGLSVEGNTAILRFDRRKRDAV